VVSVDAGPALDPGIEQWFGDGPYQRGGVLLHALRRTVGDDDFFEILQRWVEENSGTSVTTDDFIELSEEVSGDDLQTFFDDWLSAEQVPELP
jgi:aminopeptidase N